MGTYTICVVGGVGPFLRPMETVYYGDILGKGLINSPKWYKGKMVT
jgi:hypothetical protein